ncbi:MAG: hypothetical protein J6Y74_00075 [Clostridia bacterium]|nr:hypothetical protein [Clostridia bacterium]
MDDFFDAEFTKRIKKFHEYANGISDEVQRVLQAALDEMEQWKKLVAPIIEENRKIAEMLPKLRIPDSLKAVSELGKAQYVYWDYLSHSFIDKVLGADDTDAMLLAHESRNDYAESEALIAKCAKHKCVLPNKSLFQECMQSYHGGAYHLAAIGLVAVIDAALTEATKDPSHSGILRCHAILNRMEDQDPLDEEEYAIVALCITFNSTIEAFYKKLLFSEEEPKNLNRHWIAHGRSTRDYTRLDCIKLLRLLYGIIVFNEIGNADA